MKIYWRIKKDDMKITMQGYTYLYVISPVKVLKLLLLSHYFIQQIFFFNAQVANFNQRAQSARLSTALNDF